MSHFIHDLKAQFTTFAQDKYKPVEIGKTIPNFKLFNKRGNEQYLLTDGQNRDLLLFIYRSDCSACDENKKYWASIKKNHSADIKIKYIPLDKKKEIPQSSTYKECYYPYQLTKFKSTLKAYVTPLTIYLSNKRKVKGYG
jgi:hypothetical protein